MPKRAMITGITGQDGSYLAELLLAEGYEVIGMVRRSSTVTFERIAHLQDSMADLAGDELQPTARRLVVEQDAGAGVQPIGLAVVDRDPMAVHLGDAVRGTGVQRRVLGLGHFLHLAEHLAGRCLVEADLRIDQTDGVGERVSGGDPVAQVGASGGAEESGLYFELRHDGRPFDPMRWVAR